MTDHCVVHLHQVKQPSKDDIDVNRMSRQALKKRANVLRKPRHRAIPKSGAVACAGSQIDPGRSVSINILGKPRSANKRIRDTADNY